MSAVRRIYVYLVTFAALATLALGVANLVRALLEVWVSTPSATSPGYLQDQVSLWGAAALVGLPVWFVHWRWAQRLASSIAERSSALRRLFVYAVLASSTIALWIALEELLSGVVASIIGAPIALARVAIPPLPVIAAAAGVWGYHWRVAASDRAAVGETGASATLRRWYMFGFALVGFVALLSGVQTILMSTWLVITAASSVRYTLGAPGVSTAIIGLSVWVVHWGWLPRTLDPATRQQDQRSTLRSVYLFVSLAIVLVGTLGGLSQALYYVLGRLLGLASPGGVAGSLVQAAAGPVSVASAYGVGWWCQGRVINRSTGEFEAPRQLGVRRIYEYLTALVALGVLAIGLAGLLWMLGDVITHPVDTLGADWWRDRLSLFATLSTVGLPVWLLHWAPRVAAESESLARRIYLYASLVCAMLAVLISGAATLYRLLSLALGSTSSSFAMLELSHAVAVALVAAGIAAYQWRTLRSDAQARVAEGHAQAPARSVVELTAATQTAIDAALEALREQGLTVRRRAA